jgi:uncharacterized protein YcfJ
MFKKLTLAAAALATVATAAAPTAASAQSWRGDRYERDYYNDRQYTRRGARCENGDGGTVIGAIAGGLLGNTVAGRGNRLLGTILGGGVGAVAGRAIDRADPPRYCNR